MKAIEVSMMEFLQKPQQFLIPIYQRTYSWTEKQCEQLWKDIERAAAEPEISSHFIGSIVYIKEGIHQVSIIPQLQVIDGQQRLTTLTLLFAAFAKAVKQKGSSDLTAKSIEDYFLFNSNAPPETRNKLILTQSDRDTLRAIIEDREIPEKHSENCANNFEYFQGRIAKSKMDLDTIWRGISKLVMVDISLDASSDKPQIIFESLNSTGMELSKADLIRNFILMGLRRDIQEKVYVTDWYPIEEGFKKSPQEFDDFIKDYLTIRTGEIPIIRDVYPVFKEYARNRNVEELVKDIRSLAKFYTRLVFENEPDKELNQKIHNINALKSDAVYPFLIEIYSDYDKGIISKNDILEIFEIVECYIFRRAVCEIPSNSHNKTFASLADRMDTDQRVESLKAAFHLMSGYRRFPSDKEFEGRLVSKDVYNTVRIRKHLLDRLENHDRKERIDISGYTIEHIMPQNDNISQEWKDTLGPSWKEVHEEYLHTVGNLTLTGYNPELSDRPFLEKRDMKGGFADSPIRLNSDLARLERWGKPEILNRGRTLSKRATVVWRYPHLHPEILSKYAKMDDDDDPEDDESLTTGQQWESRLEQASVQVQHDMNVLISEIRKKITCVEEYHDKYLVLYIRKPTERKTMFARLWCGKSVANMAFRINPDTFQTSENVRKVAGWFFPAGAERRISVTKDNMSEIMSLLQHSYDATVSSINK